MTTLRVFRPGSWRLAAVGWLLALAIPATQAAEWDAPWSAGSRDPAPPILSARNWAADAPVSQPRTYQGENLEYVLMPIGGIGTGTIWLDGQGRLRVWQIFNNYDERQIPDSFFAIRAQAQGASPVVRALQTVGQPGFQPMRSLEFEGGYPIARLTFDDPELPVSVRLEGFNPLIPTDTANSALPCAVFRVTATNGGEAPVQVQVLGSLHNALSVPAEAGMAVPGGPFTDAVSEDAFAGVFMHQGTGPLAPGLVKVRSATGREMPGQALVWLDRLVPPDGAVEDRQSFETRVEQLGGLMRDGGAALVGGLTPEFFDTLAALKEKERAEGIEIFEDFEGDSYEGWVVKGDGFGKSPSRGTSPGQQRVSGFIGGGLVNTFNPGDGPQGELVSDAFTIEKPFIGFMIGGGSYVGQTCLQLRVGEDVVRAATGKNEERLELSWWDVSEFVGKQAWFEIIDRHSGGWGHINVDHIFFSNVRSNMALEGDRAYPLLSKHLNWPMEGVTVVTSAAGVTASPAGALAARTPADPWVVRRYTRIPNIPDFAQRYEVLASAPGGDPLIIKGGLGKATAVLCLASDLPASWVQPLLEVARGEPLAAGERLTPASANFGSLALTSPDDSATGSPWTNGDTLVTGFAQAGALPDGPDPGVNGAVISPLTVPPGESRTATFVITWHVPNVERLGGHVGNLYSRRFPDALAVARRVNERIGSLWGLTNLYHTTLYQSNLPPEWLDAAGSQSVIFRGPTVWWAEDGYFGGFEGSYGCCPLNCTHVWNYAQSHARLFPQLGRNMRQSDLLVYMHEDGETSHRQHSAHGAFIDGQAAAIMAAYREYQMSPDTSFLESVWPSLKLATDWLIERIDSDHDGVPGGHQPNTYDCSVAGANTFIGSQYLAALAAAERMATVMDEPEPAARWREIREAGMTNQDEQLWNGEYYIQIPGDRPARDYNTGCHSDQLLGQWWAHQVGLGYLYPQDRIRSCLSAIMTHNFREELAGFTQRPRRYVLDDEGGLLMCTWPQGGRPDPFIIYADEVWTGIEYSTAGAMIYEGMIDQARKIVSTARSRYDGRRRDGLNSGPGGNPFNELECGKFYARAMSSWGLIIAAQGLIIEGPAGMLGFKPNWQPEDHRSFFTAPEAWGLFTQTRTATAQTERIDVRYGRIPLRQLVFEVPAEAQRISAAVQIDSRAVAAQVTRAGQEVRLALAEGTVVSANSAVEVALRWGE